jgi:hypothetical protein
MKISVKIIAYCLWIGFLIWLSSFGSPYFFDFVSFIKTKIFGDIDPLFTYTNDPLIGNDIFSGSLIRTAGEDVGTYPILIGTLMLGPNYSIQYTLNILTIRSSRLIIKPNPIIRTYGDAPLPNTIVTSNFMVTGLRNNETIKSVTITLPTGLETGNGFKDPIGIYKNVIETSSLLTGTAILSNYDIVLLFHCFS